MHHLLPTQKNVFLVCSAFFWRMQRSEMKNQKVIVIPLRIIFHHQRTILKFNSLFPFFSFSLIIFRVPESEYDDVRQNFFFAMCVSLTLSFAFDKKGWCGNWIAKGEKRTESCSSFVANRFFFLAQARGKMLPWATSKGQLKSCEWHSFCDFDKFNDGAFLKCFKVAFWTFFVFRT